MTLLNVFECFVIYDYAVEKEPIAGVRYITYPSQGKESEETRVTLTLMTKLLSIHYPVRN